ncbi:hypothetical protein R6V09_08160 [Streptomyces sp. W16]|uniref:hypothetical protein n=1 Tax=Streptomyces sp. W16 TaxID=3076631 RepID=UPI00295B5CED|nr:hypothetical protein [Streptomyces sp. W16]MDV9170113.1 hypothetical protein [Streptomyces sp. W16]
MFRSPVLVRAALAAAVALLVTACSAQVADVAGQSSGTRAAPVTPARLGRTLPDDPVRMVLPATGAETRWTQGLYVFGQEVTRAAASDCARRGGFALPQEIPLAFIRFFALPDLDFIARHGLSTSADIPATVPGPSTVRAGTAAEVSGCRAEGVKAAAVLSDIYLPVEQRWFGQLGSLDDDPAIVRAQRGLSGCLSGRGVRARDEKTFMAVADARQNSATAAELPATERELGRIYATCMRPVEAARAPARLRLRTGFLAEHPAEIRTLRTKLLPAVHRAERRYGLTLVFPEP